MTSEAQPSAIRRKAGVGRPPPEIGRLTAAKAVRSSVVQAADDTAGLAATAGLVEESRVTLEPFIASLPDPALLALLEGPGERYGLMVLDAQVVAALIEMQTTGRVVPRPAEPRAPTRTDAIMCADFVDRVLELVEERVAEAELDVAPALAGFRYALALAEQRAIAMTLEDIPYRAFRFDIDLGRGAKSGAMQILLPFDPPGRPRTGGAEAQAFAEAMRAQVLETRAELSATLLRRRMTLAEVARLEIGTLITVPRTALAGITIETVDGRVLAAGKLGQVNGHRAVRLVLVGTVGGADAARGTAAPPPPGARPPIPAAAIAQPAPELPAPAIDPAPPSPELAGTGAPDAGGVAPAGLGDLGTSGTDATADLGGPGGLGELGNAGGLGDIGDLGDLGDLGSLGGSLGGGLGGGLGD